MHSGNYFLDWMRERLDAKGIDAVRRPARPDAARESRRYRLQVIASDLSAAQHARAAAGRAKLGFDPDELEIAEAVRMSMSIPIFFDPVIRTNPSDRAST